MPSAQSLLVVASALIIFTLGALHLLLTYRSRWFYPRDPDLESQMKAVARLISQETTMWRAGIGFHASHSAGAMLFSLAYAYLALEPTQLLFKSPFLLTLGLAYLALVAILCIGVAFALAGSGFFWYWVAGLPVIGTLVHFLYRWRTRGWRRPWGGWHDVDAGRKL
jgi:polyferredoxin